MTRTYYIFTGAADTQKYRVGRKWRPDRRRKAELDMHVAWFDPPGTWYDDKWNVHYDGCDHPCASLEECKKKLGQLDGFEYANGEYVPVETVFIETKEQFKSHY